MYVGHGNVRCKGQVDFIKMTCTCGHRRYVELLRFHIYVFLNILFLLSLSVFDGGKECINLIHQFGRTSVGSITVLDLIHLFIDKVGHFENILHQFHMGNILWLGLSQIVEYILQFVRQLRNIIKHHDT